VQKVL